MSLEDFLGLTVFVGLAIIILVAIEKRKSDDE